MKMNKASLILGAVVFAVAGQTELADAAVANPVVVGPIQATVNPGDPSRDYPFFSTNIDIARYGYVEQEFFFEGTANLHSIPVPPLDTAAVVGVGNYRTRLVVRRPLSQARFNGTALIEWQNVTAGVDLDAAWSAISDHIIREGYAWVGVSTQAVGVAGLKVWSPTRYGTLDVTEGGTVTPFDALSFDIFSQAVQAVRSPAGTSPLGDLQVRRVIAMGVSQAANRLAIYHNSIHPLAGVADGFLLIGGVGMAGVPLRTDLDVKVFKLLSESDITLLTEFALRQPDSNHFRRWEVAGAAHFDFQVAQALTPLLVRDGFPGISPTCTLPALSRIPYHYAANAAVEHLVRWIRHNVEPPGAPEIEIVTGGPPAVVARDGFGNALGGIRLPQFAVPTATNTGVNTGPGFCRLYGSFQPFDSDTLQSLYSNHGFYVHQVTQSARENVWNGFLLKPDAADTVEAAAHSALGKKSAGF